MIMTGPLQHYTMLLLLDEIHGCYGQFLFLIERLETSHTKQLVKIIYSVSGDHARKCSEAIQISDWSKQTNSLKSDVDLERMCATKI